MNPTYFIIVALVCAVLAGLSLYLALRCALAQLGAAVTTFAGAVFCLITAFFLMAGAVMFSEAMESHRLLRLLILVPPSIEKPPALNPRKPTNLSKSDKLT